MLVTVLGKVLKYQTHGVQLSTPNVVETGVLYPPILTQQGEEKLSLKRIFARRTRVDWVDAL
jgi:hypothetical protein